MAAPNDSPCVQCTKQHCCSQYSACEADQKCSQTAACVAAGGSATQCYQMYMPNFQLVFALQQCLMMQQNPANCGCPTGMMGG
jgi:hypothetical protein